MKGLGPMSSGELEKARIIKTLQASGIIPVIRAPGPGLALLAVEAVRAGGIQVVEVTMTVPNAVSLIESLVKRYGDEMLIGAGTVLDAKEARDCLSAGAAFVVSPIVDEAVISCCQTFQRPVLPGALTPGEILRAVRSGGDMVKVFPCGAMGGASYIRSLKAPFPDIDLVPTGGVSEHTIGHFIHAGASAVGVGADLIDIDKLVKGRADEITGAARRYLAAVRAARTSAPGSP